MLRAIERITFAFTGAGLLGMYATFPDKMFVFILGVLVVAALCLLFDQLDG